MNKQKIATICAISFLYVGAHTTVNAASCAFTNTSNNLMNFGVYTSTHGNQIAGTGSITLTCSDSLIPVSYGLTIDQGLYGSFLNRKMQTANGNTIDYNLYKDPLHQVIIGDGSVGSSTDTISGSCAVLSPCIIPIHGLIPVQPLPNGSFSDTVTITITF